MADYIPFEIQEDIMKRLPTKSLMRFRSVSKPYKSLIENSEFIAEYSFNHIHQEHLLVSYVERGSLEYKHVTIVDDDTFPQENHYLHAPLPGPVYWSRARNKIIGNSQGLFWLYNQTCDPSDLRKTITESVLWNPSIRKFVDVDVLDHPVDFVGFGVCPVTRDPKVVTISHTPIMFRDTEICTSWQVNVYTLSSRAWRSIPSITQPRNSVDFVSYNVVIDEFIYWLAIDSHKYNRMIGNLESRYYMMVLFDLTNEKFMEVSLPDTLANVQVDKLVSKLKDCLVVVEELKQAEKQSYAVWIMDHCVPNTFTKLYIINSPYASIHGVFGFRKNNEPIFDMTTNYAVFYVQELQSENINYAAICGSGLSFSVFSYMETLLLLDH